ncbi:HET-domain-containing protein, partial [Rhizodiscina lignyota]
MRLIDTRTLELKEFLNIDLPKYAILSHTWEEEEITFEQFQGLHDELKHLQGFKKIQNACEVARLEKLGYAWCDTCCIDKRSSSELSEAINSMFKWYRDSEICIAYLADVPNLNGVTEDPWLGEEDEPHFANAEIELLLASEFAKSRWHTRGWTLQELIAPRRVRFYSKDWEYLANKEEDISHALSYITGVPVPILRNAAQLMSPIRGPCAANKMSWAANRATSRVEDTAYCLLGLFGVNMPLLYGEGSRAFTRLQEEIIRISDDHSIFVFEASDERPVLAPSPAAFTHGARIVRLIGAQYASPEPYAMTNKGLRIRLPL